MKLKSTIILSIIAFAGLSSCKSQKEIVEKTKIENTAIVSTIGIPYFKAVGTEPFWGIEISEKELKFTEAGNEKGMIFPNENFDMLQEDMKLTYTNKTDMLIIESKPGECSDGMSDQRFSHKVSITLIDGETGATRELFGCGQFFASPQLNEMWVLETLREQPVTVKDYENNLPSLEFVVDKNMFSGFAGCNSINGKMKANSDNRLQLIDIASTRMMCGPDNKEQQFLNVLAKVGAYKFDGDTLILLDPTYVPVATFKKK